MAALGDTYASLGIAVSAFNVQLFVETRVE
jgi:hypothetical protein